MGEGFRMLDASRLRPRQPSTSVVFVGVVAATVTAVVWGVPALVFAYPLPGVAVFATALTSVSALAVCILFALRHRRTRRRTDFLLAALFGVIALVEGVLPIVAQISPDTVNFAYWTRMVARSFVSLGLCLAAWLPERTATRHRYWSIVAITATITSLAVGWTLLMGSGFPSTVDDAENAGSALVTDPTMLAMRLVGTVLLLVAAAGLVKKSRRLSDPVLIWVGCGAVLMATARVHDFLFPSLHNDWLTTGDILRLVAQCVILFALLREMSVLWERRARDARAQERRTLAAELHDGLAQELAYLTMQTALAEREPDNTERLARVHAAAERALAETRLQIGHYRDKPLDSANRVIALDCVIAEVSRDIEARFGCRVSLNLESMQVAPRTAHELGRAACEAMQNAARHSRSGEIRVRLDSRARVLRLHIEDDGDGIIDLTDGGARKFGLISMRERAERLGGHCSIVSAPADGTRVAIEVPRR